MYSNPTIIWIAREGGAFTGFKCALCAKRTRPPLLKRHLRALLPSQLCPLGFFKTAANSLKHTGTQTNKHMNKQLKTETNKKNFIIESGRQLDPQSQISFLEKCRRTHNVCNSQTYLPFQGTSGEGKPPNMPMRLQTFNNCNHKKASNTLYVILKDHILLR